LLANLIYCLAATVELLLLLLLLLTTYLSVVTR